MLDVGVGAGIHDTVGVVAGAAANIVPIPTGPSNTRSSPSPRSMVTSSFWSSVPPSDVHGIVARPAQNLGGGRASQHVVACPAIKRVTPAWSNSMMSSPSSP